MHRDMAGEGRIGAMRRAARTGFWRAWGVGLLMLFALDAAAMRHIDPGDDPRLAADEGLVVLAIDASAKISSIHVGRVGGGTAAVLNYVDVGRNLRLYAAKAGEYQWSQVNVLGWSTRTRFELGTAEYRFTVVPGKITYPGDLILRPTSWTTTSVHVANRSLPVIDWLEGSHAALYRQLPFAYAGHYPDPFPDHYRAARAGNTQPADKLNAGREPPKPAALPLPAELMWKPDRVTAIALNPAGNLLAQTVRDEKDHWGLLLVDLDGGFQQRLATTLHPATSLMWKDDRTLIVASGGGRQSHSVYRVDVASGDKRGIRHLPINGSGRVVDLLPAEPGTILFEGYDSRGDLVVHRVVLDGDKSINGFQTAKSRDRLNLGASKDLGWYADGHGRLRAVVVLRDEEQVLLHGRDGAFTEVLRYRSEGGFMAAGLSFDGDTIYGYTDEGRSQRDLVAFDPATRQVTRTLFTRPGSDVVGIVFDDRREPVAARYYQSGRLVTEYFAGDHRALDAMLQSAFPGRTVAVIDRSRDGSQLVLWVDGSDRPPQLFHLDVPRKRASLLEEITPWLADKAFAPAHVLKVKGSDGLPIEAFLTLPAGTGKRPLVLYPHGGPIGVSDSLHFSRDVQFLASQGYAVLQVNFRGSEGYGKAFREAGHRNYGRLIEDDIDAALRAALAAYPLDEQRMCTLGASYGGYSALVSAIRWPGRFRCAVSLSGLSDRALFFSASDSVRTADARPVLERIMGNPRTDMAEMQATSPLYHARELTLPLMLVHGREDLRVDFEHTRRLVRMLNLDGRPPVLLAFPDMGHGFDDPVAEDIAWTGIAGFLGVHLGAAAAAPVAGAAGASTAPVGQGAAK